MGNVALVVWAQDVENDEGQDRKILCCSLTAPVTDHWRHKSLVYAMTGSLWRYLPFLWVRLPATVRKWAHKSRQEFCWGSGTNLPGKPLLRSSQIFPRLEKRAIIRASLMTLLRRIFYLDQPLQIMATPFFCLLSHLSVKISNASVLTAALAQTFPTGARNIRSSYTF